MPWIINEQMKKGREGGVKQNEVVVGYCCGLGQKVGMSRNKMGKSEHLKKNSFFGKGRAFLKRKLLSVHPLDT